MTVALRGFAATYNQIGFLDDNAETIAPRAFRNLLSARHNTVFINWRDHDEPPIARGVEFFNVQDYGLGFRVEVSDRVWQNIRSGLMCDVQRCSVMMTNVEREPANPRIIAADVEHVTLCSKAAFAGTGVWAEHLLDELPPRLHSLNERWEKGRALADFITSLRATRRPPAGSHRMTPELRAYFSARQGEYTRMRQWAASAVAMGRPVILSHTAFSKAAAFDESDFYRMVAQARGPSA